MRRKQKYLFLTMVITAVMLWGCGTDKIDETKNTEEMVETENTVDHAKEETESIVDSTENTNQLQLGTAVEIPEGWDGSLSEDTPKEDLEAAIQKHYQMSGEDWENARYYYNYVDLNGDSKNEILVMVVRGENGAGPSSKDMNTTGKTKSVSSEVERINETELSVPEGAAPSGRQGSGYTLLWIDSDAHEIQAKHIRQEFTDVKSPVYISNHMTGGYRDLILCQYGEGISGANYRLMVWDGEKYVETEQLEGLEGYEGNAVLTDNMEIHK